MDLLAQQRDVPSVCLINGGNYPKNRTISWCAGEHLSILKAIFFCLERFILSLFCAKVTNTQNGSNMTVF